MKDLNKLMNFDEVIPKDLKKVNLNPNYKNHLIQCPVLKEIVGSIRFNENKHSIKYSKII